MGARICSLVREGFPGGILLTLVLLWVWAGGAAVAQDDAWRNAPPTSTGIPVGKKIPAFSIPDQNGKAQSFESIKGPNGAAIYFMRSADW